MAIKLIAIDLDGTLLNDKKQISKTDLAALEAVTAKGVQIVVCTGRPLLGVHDILPQIPVGNEEEYIIVNNGGSIHRLPDLEVIHERTVPQEPRAEIYQFVQEFKHYDIQLTGSDLTHFYLVDDQQPIEVVYKDAEILKADITPINYEKYMKINPLHKTLLYGEEDRLDLTEREIPSVINELVDVVRSQPFIIEFLPKKVNKASGLAKLMKALKVSANEVMAIGDELNDLEMLEMAGVSVAMDNSHPTVKRVARYKTLSNNDSGVAHALHSYVI